MQISDKEVKSKNSTNSIVTHFFFNDYIDRVFDLIKDLTKTDALFSKIRSKVIFITGKTTYDIGNYFYYKISNQKLVFYVINLIDFDKFKSITWKIHEKDEIYYLTSSLYLNTSDDSVLLEAKVEFCNKREQFAKIFYLDFIEQQYFINTKIEKLLMNNISKYYDMGTCLIKTNMVSIWKSMMNLDSDPNQKKFFLGNIIKIGDMEEIGTTIIFDNPELNINLVYKVSQVIRPETSDKWIYRFSETNKDSLIRDIEYVIEKISEDKCLLRLYHYFNKYIPTHIKQMLLSKKDLILYCLKKNSKREFKKIIN